MATTKIWPTKGHLASVLKYIVNEQKSDAKTYVSGLNCFPDTAAAEMNAVKKHFGKTGGRVAYHAYQSFAPGEVTPDQAHQIGVQLANELWGDRFQVVIATHLDRGHLHNHFVLNSVSFGDGKRFHSDAAAGCIRPAMPGIRTLRHRAPPAGSHPPSRRNCRREARRTHMAQSHSIGY